MRKAFNLPSYIGAQQSYDPPANLLYNDGRYGTFVEAPLSLTPDTSFYLQSLSDKLRPGKPRAFSGVFGFVLENAGIVLMAPKDDRRAYLLGPNKEASELPVLPLENLERDNGKERFVVTLTPATWSVMRYMEKDMHIPVDLSLRFGMAVMKARADNPELTFSLVDSQGRVREVDSPLPRGVNLWEPPELI